MKSPFFSIIVPCYNRAALLHGVIVSIQQQQFTNFEILVVDDGSTDNTRELVDGIALKDKRILYSYQQNAERGAARNKGIRDASGEFILFLDSDDQMRPDCLQLLSQGIAGNPTYNFYAVKYFFWNNGRALPSTISGLAPGSYGYELLLRGNPFACNFCVRKNNPDLKLFDEDRSLATTEDWMFLVRNLYKDKIYLFDFGGIVMHQHEERSMQQHQRLIETRIKATAKLDSQIPFSEREKKILWSYTYQFCSVHAYLEGNQRQSLEFLKKAVNVNGWSGERLLYLLKYIIGRSAVTRIKAVLGKG